ncbi:E3 ubiquitin-protein ligase RNF128a isoform X1 [Electrophorus electricus]|uniref:E3 ubiquitin-protein ligase RNF128a isoform X1 n=1 Tax=Electrophorus electricus TaxID=8005 RepID=UPI0015D009ED|nr:E3 ubiquitin-protein ligase RNF128a isoform X1 [Electrophorus electricus]
MSRTMGPIGGPRLFSWLVVASYLQSSVQLTQATYFCTAYLNVSFVAPETNQTVWRQEEIGLYGQESPKVPVVGNVYLPAPIYGCDSDAHYDRPKDSKGWIALIQRGQGCTFTEKINVAASQGAIAAVIFNDFGTDNRVIQMSHPGTSIVAVMIGNTHGMELVELLQSNVAVTIAIEVGQQHSPWISPYSVFFVSISFFIITAATVGYFIFYSAQRLNSVRVQNRKQKQLKAEAKKAIGQLKVLTLKQGDKETGPDADSCAVCIEPYSVGDVLSVLTCSHFFHKACVEPWLLEHRTCPMCKCDVLKALGVELEDEEQQVPLPSDVQSFPIIQNDSQTHIDSTSHPHSDGASHTHGEVASSGYESMQVTEQQGTLADAHSDCDGCDWYAGQEAVRVEVQPHYDNLAFEHEAHS